MLPMQDDRVSIPPEGLLRGGEFIVADVNKGNTGGEVTLYLKRAAARRRSPRARRTRVRAAASERALRRPRPDRQSSSGPTCAAWVSSLRSRLRRHTHAGCAKAQFSE